MPNGFEVPMTRPCASRAWTRNVLEPWATGIAVSKADFAAEATRACAPELAPPSTRHDFTSVAPFQLA